jgi:molybdopterin-guanine dinucleotide biosynthesis protein A
MGASKPALFLDRIARTARPVFDDVIAVQRAGGTSVNGLRTIFEEPHEGDGAIFGVARALRDAEGDAFIVAVDYPLITSDVLRFIRDQRRVPVWNGVPQPLCAVWSLEQLPSVEARIAARTFDLQPLAGHAMIDESVLRERFAGEPLMNVNTPEELEAAERLYGERFLPSR